MVEGDVYPEKSMESNESAPRQLSIGPLKNQDAGAIVRTARLAAGLTLADLGRRCGYSASQVSRYERGIQPLTDITLLRRFSQVLAIPPQAFGLTPSNGSRASRHAVDPKDGIPSVAWPRVSREPRWETVRTRCDAASQSAQRTTAGGATSRNCSSATATPPNRSAASRFPRRSHSERLCPHTGIGPVNGHNLFRLLFRPDTFAGALETLDLCQAVKRYRV